MFARKGVFSSIGRAGAAATVFGFGWAVVAVAGAVLVGVLAGWARLGPAWALLPVGALGAWVYYRDGNLNVRYSLLIAAGLLVGAFLGAKLVQPVSDLTLRRMFGGFLLLVSVKMLWGK